MESVTRTLMLGEHKANFNSQDFHALMDELEHLAKAQGQGAWLIEDACHALGAEYHGKRVGGIADMTVFSFHPVKHLTTGEGGMVTDPNTNGSTWPKR